MCRYSRICLILTLLASMTGLHGIVGITDLDDLRDTLRARSRSCPGTNCDPVDTPDARTRSSGAASGLSDDPDPAKKATKPPRKPGCCRAGVIVDDPGPYGGMVIDDPVPF